MNECSVLLRDVLIQHYNCFSQPSTLSSLFWILFTFTLAPLYVLFSRAQRKLKIESIGAALTKIEKTVGKRGVDLDGKIFIHHEWSDDVNCWKKLCCCFSSSSDMTLLHGTKLATEKLLVSETLFTMNSMWSFDKFHSNFSLIFFFIFEKGNWTFFVSSFVT